MKSKLLLIIISVLSISFPGFIFGQAPNLGTTANFELFSTVGAVSNTGISQVTGNVGTNSGSSTGFGNVNGQMHDNDVASAQCAADLTIAYNDLSSAIPTFFPAPLLGNGVTFVPGVYSVSGPATLNLDLNLDAAGDPTAVFIIRILGAFSTNANAKIKLVNGALACNVFWQVEGLVSMGTGTTMRGTIIANNAAINMSSGDTLEGRALTTAGAITIDGVLAYTPIGCGSPVLTGPVGPNLASMECYTIFSSDGPVTNTGPSIIVGDIGTNNGTVTGYNPLLVTGIIHTVPDASTATAAVDLLNAYTYLSSIPYDIELLYPPQFGNNLVLTPHKYILNGAVTFTDSLYLNAEGNPNAVFVIHIFGALSTSTFSKVILINGTQSQNVFWVIDGAVDINNFSVFRGTIICNNGAMNINSGVTLDGRVLTTTGALATFAINAVMPPGCSSVSAPLIMTEPADQAVCEGGSANFTVMATGTNLTYQWRKGNVNLVDGGNISGATTATLTINPAMLADAATNYNVIVSGTYAPSDTSINVSLVIDTAPSITTQPSDQFACIGDQASFSVVVTGLAPTYQWRKGIVNLINGGSISGATTSTLTINPVTALDAALDYNVVVNGLCLPNTTSANAELQVGSSPDIVSEPVDQTVCAGSSVSFNVLATGNNLTYQWRKGLVNLVNGGSISGATTSTLTINPANLSDAATNYNVIVIGTCLPNDTSVNVSLVIDGPIIIAEPVSQSVCAGNPVSFTVIATGSGLTYQWRKGAVLLVNGGSVSGVTTSTLTINPVSVLDAALNYNVVVSGTCLPGDTSVNVSLTVESAPAISAEPSDEIVCEGASVSFTVTATGNGLSYQWYNGTVMMNNAGSVSGANTNTITINPISISDSSSNYNVVVSGNCAPNDTSINVMLTVTPLSVAIASGNSPVCVDGTINLNAQTVSGATYLWSGPNGYTSPVQNPVISSVAATDAGIYTLVVSNNGCNSLPSTVNISVNTCIVTDFFIPEGFSPNGDGINDLFVIRGISNFPDNKFVIYNRWGVKVYEANSYLSTWDGTSTEGLSIGGEKLPVGTYFYLLDLGNETDMIKGTIYLNN